MLSRAPVNQQVPALSRGTRWCLLLLLAGIYLIGLAHIAVLPPFEGFDETGHYSYLRQIALTGRWTRYGDTMSADIDAYLAAAPTASAMQAKWSYRGFFSAPVETVEAGRAAIHAPRSDHERWQFGRIGNWQAQHPPLYYVLLAPAFHLSKNWSLAAQLLFLRALSYTLACAGVTLALGAAFRLARARGVSAEPFVLAPVLWPLLLPMWFPEMARLGNDSLVVLLAALTWVFVARITSAERDWRSSLGLGLVLGLGLLTKATFIPLAAAVAGLLAVWFWRGVSCENRRRAAINMAWMAGVAFMMAGWWYIAQFITTGSLTGSTDAIHLGHAGGLWQGLRERASLQVFGQIPWSWTNTVVWAGTWSFLVPPLRWFLPLLAAWAVIGVGAAIYLTQRGLRGIEWLAPMSAALLLGALLSYSLILIARTGAPSPAWYLHSFLPVLWPLLAWGLAGAMGTRGLRWTIAPLLAYPPVFLALVAAMHALFFSGCGTQKEGMPIYDFSSAAGCAADLARLRLNLDVLAFPDFGSALFAVGLLALLAGTGLAVGVVLRAPSLTSMQDRT